MDALDYNGMVEGASADDVSRHQPSRAPPSHYHRASVVYSHDPDKAKSLLKGRRHAWRAADLRTTDGDQVVAMSTVKRNLEDLGFRVTIQTGGSDATYASTRAIATTTCCWRQATFGGSDLVLRWWYGNDVWMRALPLGQDPPRARGASPGDGRRARFCGRRAANVEQVL